MLFVTQFHNISYACSASRSKLVETLAHWLITVQSGPSNWSVYVYSGPYELWLWFNFQISLSVKLTRFMHTSYDAKSEEGIMGWVDILPSALHMGRSSVLTSWPFKNDHPAWLQLLLRDGTAPL